MVYFDLALIDRVVQEVDVDTIGIELLRQVSNACKTISCVFPKFPIHLLKFIIRMLKTVTMKDHKPNWSHQPL